MLLNNAILSTDVLLITPPFTQLNTPYPATAYLKGFLNTKGISCTQADLGIDVILHLFSKAGLKHLFESVDQSELSVNGKRIYALQSQYIKVIDPIIAFLQGKNNTLAHSISSENYLPEAARFNQLNDLEWAFGNMGTLDKAKHLATLFLEDISDFIIENVDPYFGFSRYAERISAAARHFDELNEVILSENSYITSLALPILETYIQQNNPKLISFSIPFPGNLLSAFKCAQYIKQKHPLIKIAFGGGYPNTELRSVKDIRVFDFVDFICLDDGEAPLEQLYAHIVNNTGKATLKRTLCLDNDIITYYNNPAVKDYKQSDVGTPDYSGLKLDQYISVIEVTNPMHSLWSDGRWNKLTLAHGCYWGKCTFCDITLDYIKNYEPLKAIEICDRIESLIESTGESGFHFVDEAAPPALMRDLALELIRRDLSITWWTNIRFEKNFTYDLCQLLKKSGCIAVSGGIEVASDRLLKLIDKGVDLHQLATVTSNFSEAGIMVHAYLMYGFPTQTDLETINSLEIVRQLFENEIVHSGFWHQFAMTAHSPVGLNPEKFNVKNVLTDTSTFAHNDLPHDDPSGCDHQKYSQGLKIAIYNYMHGTGFEKNLQEWFDFPVKQKTISPHFIEDILNGDSPFTVKPNTKIVWTETIPQIDYYSVKKKGKTKAMAKMEFHTQNNQFSIKGNTQLVESLQSLLKQCSIHQDKLITFKSFEAAFSEKTDNDINDFFNSPQFDLLKANGLLFL